MATALLGSFSSGSTGNVAKVTALAGANYNDPAVAQNAVKVRLIGAGLTGAAANDISLNIATTDTLANVVANLNTAIAANTTLAATGITAVASGSKVAFQGRTGETFEVLVAGDIRNALGYGSYASAAGIANTATTFDYNNITAAEIGRAHV